MEDRADSPEPQRGGPVLQGGEEARRGTDADSFAGIRQLPHFEEATPLLDTTYTLFVVRGPLETPTLILKTARRSQATMHGLAVALAGLPEVEVRLAHKAIVSRVAV